MTSRAKASAASLSAAQSHSAISRRADGLPGLAVSWGTWAGAGMAHRFGSGFEKYWRAQGMGFIGLDKGLAMLGMLMAPLAAGADAATRLPHYAFLPADWAAYGKARGARKPQPLTVALVDAATPVQAAPTTGAAASLSAGARSPLGQRLLTLAQAARARGMESEMAEVINEMLDSDEELDFSLPVSDVGLT